MSAMYCEGCDNIFTSRGLASHLRQTRDPLCQHFAVELEQDAGMRQAKSPSPVNFGGDIFGGPDEYADDNFGQVDHPEILEHLNLDPLADDFEDVGTFP